MKMTIMAMMKMVLVMMVVTVCYDGESSGDDNGDEGGNGMLWW